MNLLEGMNRALDYIEDNLDGELDYAVLARTACCSVYHFQRIFVSVTDIPLSEYIRRRRLTRAAIELQATNEKIIDVALKYGYQSSDAFTRAFVALHGIVPSQARKKGAVLKAYARLTFTLSIKGVVALKYRFEEKKAFRVVGVRKWFSAVDNGQLKEIPRMWDSVIGCGTFAEMCALMDGTLPGTLGICGTPYNEGFDYWIAVTSEKPCPSGLEETEIPAATWVVFEAEGPVPDAIQAVWGRIFTEWFPNSGYEHTKAPELEVYPDGTMDAPDYKCEIWVPVVKKQ